MVRTSGRCGTRNYHRSAVHCGRLNTLFRGFLAKFPRLVISSSFLAKRPRRESARRILAAHRGIPRTMRPLCSSRPSRPPHFSLRAPLLRCSRKPHRLPRIPRSRRRRRPRQLPRPPLLQRLSPTPHRPPLRQRHPSHPHRSCRSAKSIQATAVQVAMPRSPRPRKFASARTSWSIGSRPPQARSRATTNKSSCCATNAVD